MKVPTVDARTLADPVRRRRSVGGGDGGFAEALSAASGSDAAAATIAPGIVSSVLALQEVPTAADQPARRRAVGRAEGILDELDRLRHDLLTGVMPASRVSGLLERMRRQREMTDDPLLEGIIDDIELRAEVELAKLERQRP